MTQNLVIGIYLVPDMRAFPFPFIALCQSVDSIRSSTNRLNNYMYMAVAPNLPFDNKGIRSSKTQTTPTSISKIGLSKNIKIIDDNVCLDHIGIKMHFP